MDDPLSWLYLISIVVLLILSFFFSLAETSFATLNLFKMRVKADEGDKKAQLVVKIHTKYERTLITSLLGSNIASILSSVLGVSLFIALLGNLNIPNEVISVISTIVLTILFFLFGEIFPKLIAKAIPNKSALLVVYFSYFFYYLFYPIVILLEGLLWLFYKIFHLKEKPTLTKDDFANIVDSIEEEGLIDENESDIIHASFDFADTSVKEVLTLREKMFALDITSLSHEKLHELILKTNYSRLPIYEKDLNNIIGILHIKSYLHAYYKNNNISIRATLQKPYFVATSIKMDELFEGFKKHHTHIAIVLDTHKRVLGMVTMEDVLEELVGEINEVNPVPKGSLK